MTTDVTVRSEPHTYNRGGEHSYFADLALLVSPGDAKHRPAVARLERHATEMVIDARENTPKGRQITRALMTAHRSDDVAIAREHRRELRAATTGAGSGGAFVTPQHLVEDWAPFRTYGRAFVDQTNLHPLGDTGMTVYLPAVGADAGVATQTQNASVTEVDATASYLSASVVTAAGQMTASQQLIDRTQDASADTAIFGQLEMAYNTALDAGVVVAALAQGGTAVTDTGTLSIGTTWTDVAQAQAQMLTAAGTVLPATHTFFPILEWAWLTAQLDNAGRPIIEPQFSSPVVAPEPVAEGDCGYTLVGTKVFRDGNLPTASGNGQLIVAHMPEVWVFEGEPISRALVDTAVGRANLSVVLQRYSYYAVIVRYPNAVIPVTGAAYPVNPTV